MAEKRSKKPNDAAPPRKRSSTGRFRDRTLNWFKTGDEIDPDAPPPAGEYAPEPAGRPPWLIPAIAAAAVLVVVAIVALAAF